MLDLTGIEDTIQKRFSCRTYLEEPIDETRRDQLDAMIKKQAVGPLGSQARFILISANEEDRKALKGLVTYGFIKGAMGFIIGVVTSGPHDMEDFGYLMEEIILYATQLELGTCWLGGTFNRSGFAARASLTSTESMPAVSSLGLNAGKKNLMDRIVRRQANGDRRFGWDKLFFDSSFSQPLSKENAADYAVPLEMVRLGPSASNKQPWRIVRDGSCWHFYVQRTPNYPPAIANLADLQRVDMGIAMSHFGLTASGRGLSGSWQTKEPQIALPKHTSYIISWVTE